LKNKFLIIVTLLSLLVSQTTAQNSIAGNFSMIKGQIIQLIMRYNKWKAKEVEVVMVSLDTDKKALEDFASDFPYTLVCDYKKWDTQAAKDYYVSSSPTLFLLDSNNKIILRPPTVASLDSWLESITLK
jgi:hypothetical protein